MPRNVSGTYSLPLPPVVANTVIQAAWANTTDDDIAQAITDSLDRNGRGGMIAPFRLVDGTVLQPAFAFSSETGTGLFKVSAGVMGVSVMGTQVAQWSGTSYNVLTDLGVAGNFGVGGNFSLTGDIALVGDILGTIHVTGGIAVDGGITSLDDIGVIENFNGDAGFFAQNTSTGTSGATGIFLRNSLPDIAEFALTGTGYTAYPLAGANAALLYGNGAGGLVVNAGGAAGTIRFAAGGSTEQMRLRTDGGLAIGHVGFAGVPLLVHCAANENFGAFNISGLTSIGAFTDAGSAAALQLVGQNLYFSGNGGGAVQMTLSNVGNLTGVGGVTIGLNEAPINSKLMIGDGEQLFVSSFPGAGGTPASRSLLFGARNVFGGTPVGQAGFLVSFVRVSGDTDYGSNLAFYTSFDNSPVQRMHIDRSGNIGINFTNTNTGKVEIFSGSALRALRVMDAAGSQGSIILGDRSILAGGNDYTGWQFIDAGTMRMLLTTGGLLGLNMTPTYPIDVTSSGSAVIRLIHTGGVQAYMQANGSTDVRFGSLSNHDLLITANGSPRMYIPTGNGGIYMRVAAASTNYLIGVDAGTDSSGGGAAIPIGAIICGIASGVTWGGLAALDQITLDASNTVTLQGWTTAPALSVGTYRLISRLGVTSNVQVMRIA
jgi:hypothetical protein